MDVDVSYSTKLGACHNGDALDLLRGLKTNSVSLVLTSPPFALASPKGVRATSLRPSMSPGSLPFAKEIYRVLRPDGSFVFDLGGGVEIAAAAHGSALSIRFDLTSDAAVSFPPEAQEFYWYNPRQTADAGRVLVTIRRTRVKDAVNMLWWLSKTESPAADNRQVLKPYSPSMKRLLRDGYDPGMRTRRSTRFRRISAAITAAYITAEFAGSAEYALQRPLFPPLPRRRAADPPGSLSGAGAGVLRAVFDRGRAAGGGPVRGQ